MATRLLTTIFLVSLLGMSDGKALAARTINVSLLPLQEKDSRTPAQQKIDSQLLYAIYQMRGEARSKSIPSEEIQLKKDHKGCVLVDVRVRVSEALVVKIQQLGGSIVYRSDRDNTILAYISLARLEAIAHASSVRFIMPAPEARTH